MLRTFIAMPFNRRFQPVYEIIKRACQKNGVETVRVDEIVAPGDIYQEIETEIERCDFMIADLSGDLDPQHCNPNVALEVGYARRSRKPVILLTQSVATLPFDLKTQRAIEYSLDAEELAHLEFRLTDIVAAAIKRLLESREADAATAGQPAGNAGANSAASGSGDVAKPPSSGITAFVPPIPAPPAPPMSPLSRPSPAASTAPAAIVRQNRSFPGFRFLRDEPFVCAGVRFVLPVFRNELFARALEFADDETDIAVEFVQVPGGDFQMGSPRGEAGRQEWEGPPRLVRVAPFLIARTPMTQAVWDAVAEVSGVALTDQRNWHGDWLPLERVSWLDVGAFNGITNLRLPSEAEWEYACRAGTTSPWFFGDDPAKLADYGWFDGNADGQTHEVGSAVSGANAFGLFDMLGNVCEWVADTWRSSYAGAPLDGGPWITAGGNAPRVLRGGSWYDDPEECRCASRFSNVPGFRGDIIGFRPAVNAPR